MRLLQRAPQTLLETYEVKQRTRGELHRATGRTDVQEARTEKPP